MKKTILDERQIIEQLKVKRIAFWVILSILFVDLVMKVMVMELPFRNYALEFCAFIVGCLIETIGSAHKGIWDGYLKPTMKNYLWISAAGAAALFLLTIAVKWFKYPNLQKNLPSLLAIGLLMAGITFVLTFAALSLSGRYSQKQLSKEEEGDE